MGAIRPEFGALFGPTKSIRAGENLFAWDSALLRFSPVRFVRQLEGRCSATSDMTGQGRASAGLQRWQRNGQRVVHRDPRSVGGLKYSDAIGGPDQVGPVENVE